MKRILSLILLVGSFACGMDAPLIKQKEKEKEVISSNQNWLEQLDQKDDSPVPSLRTLCAQQATKQFGNISLQEFLQSNQPNLPQELDSLIGSQILAQSPEIATAILQQINIPCIKTLTGYNFDANYTVLRNDKKTYFSCLDGTIKLCDLDSGQCLQTLTGHTDCANKLMLSYDGKTLFSCSADRTKIWNLVQFNAINTFLYNDSTIKQAILLKDWHTAKQNNQSIDLSNPQIQKVFDSLPEEIKYVIDPSIIRYSRNNYPWKTAAGIGATALAAYGLWNYFKSDN